MIVVGREVTFGSLKAIMTDGKVLGSLFVLERKLDAAAVGSLQERDLLMEGIGIWAEGVRFLIWKILFLLGDVI